MNKKISISIILIITGLLAFILSGVKIEYTKEYEENEGVLSINEKGIEKYFLGDEPEGRLIISVKNDSTFLMESPDEQKLYMRYDTNQNISYFRIDDGITNYLDENDLIESRLNSLTNEFDPEDISNAVEKIRQNQGIERDTVRR